MEAFSGKLFESVAALGRVWGTPTFLTTLATGDFCAVRTPARFPVRGPWSSRGTGSARGPQLGGRLGGSPCNPTCGSSSPSWQ